MTKFGRVKKPKPPFPIISYIYIYMHLYIYKSNCLKSNLSSIFCLYYLIFFCVISKISKNKKNQMFFSLISESSSYMIYSTYI